VFLALLIPAAIVATYKRSFDIASLLFCAYIALNCLDFALQRAPLSRAKIASFVFAIAIAVFCLGLTTLGTLVIQRHPSVQQSPPTKP
jgi:hypothetical protein